MVVGVLAEPRNKQANPRTNDEDETRQGRGNGLIGPLSHEPNHAYGWLSYVKVCSQKIIYTYINNKNKLCTIYLEPSHTHILPVENPGLKCQNKQLLRRKPYATIFASSSSVNKQDAWLLCELKSMATKSRIPSLSHTQTPFGFGLEILFTFFLEKIHSLFGSFMT